MVNFSTLDDSETNNQDPFSYLDSQEESIDPFGYIEEKKDKDKSPGRNINPDRKRSIYIEPSVDKARTTKAGNRVVYGKTEEKSYEDIYDIRNVPVEYDDGEIGYLSYGEINNPDINPQLKKKIQDAKIANDNLEFFEDVPRGDEFGTIDTLPLYEDELKAIKDELTERKEKSENGETENTLSQLPKNFQEWNGPVPPDDLVKDYFKLQKNILDKQKAIDSEIDRAWAGFSDGERKATNIYNEDVRLKSVDAKNIKKDYDALMISAEGFQNSEESKAIVEFEKNFADPDYKFNIPDGAEKIQLADGRFISEDQFESLQTKLHAYNTNKDNLIKSYDSLIERSDIANDANEELAISKLNFSMADKLGFQFLDVGGGLLLGGMEYLEAGANLFIKGVEGYDPGLDYFEKKGQERRPKMDKERARFRKDVDFDDAFSSMDNFGRFLFEESGRQLPIFAGMIATGGAAGLAGAGTYAAAAAAGTVIGVQSAGQQIGDMTYQDTQLNADGFDYNDSNQTDAMKFLVGTGFGVAEGALGVAPTFIIGKTALSGGMRAFLKGTSDDIAMVTGKEYFKKNILKEFLIGASGESVTEGMTSVFQNLFTGRPVLENVDHAAFAGGFFGGVMGGGGVAMGAAARNMANKEIVQGVLDNGKQHNKLTKELQGYKDNKTLTLNRKRVKEIRDKLKNLQQNTADIIDEFSETWSAKMGYNVYEDYKQIVGNMYDLRAQAIETRGRTDISTEKKQALIDGLALRYKQNEAILDEFKSPDKYGNRFTLLKGTDPKRYKKILKEARAKLEADGQNTSESAINKQAELIYNQELVKATKANVQKVIKNTSLNYESDIFETEADALNRANEELAKDNLSKSEKDYWTAIKNSKKGARNGIAGRVNGVYRFATIEENEVKNSRTGTKTHEVSHLLFWDKILRTLGDNRLNTTKAKRASLEDAIAKDIIEYLEVNQPRIYADMFGLDRKQRVETKDGKFKSNEIIAGFIERVSQMDLSKPQDKSFASGFGKFISDITGLDRDMYSKPNDVIDFLITLGQKIEDGTLDAKMLDKQKIEKLFSKYDLNSEGKSTEELANSITDDKTLFETTEDIINSVDWNKLNKDQKKDVGEMIGVYWENFIRKKFRQTMSINTDDFELDNLASEFIIGEKARNRGLAEIISRYDPVNNPNVNINQWIQSSSQKQGQVDLRVLGFATKSKTFGRFESSLDEQRETGGPAFEIAVNDDALDINETTKQFNQFRKLLNIEFEGDLYNKTLEVNTETFLNLKDAKGKFKGKTVKELLDVNPRRARTIIQDYAAKNLRADITNIIGAQKSQKFKDFIRNEQKLQSLINLIAVKHRSSFPFLSKDGGTMGVKQSKANIDSDQGSFVSDVKAGNTIWNPIQLNEMNADEKAKFVSEVEKAFVDGLKVKEFALDGTIEYNGRETVHKALKDALANELILDATFTAMENSGSLNAMYDGITGKLAENIKRDPELAFSVSEAGGLQQLTKLAKDVLKTDYDSVFDSYGVLSDKYKDNYTPEMAAIIQDIYDSGLIQDQSTLQFLRAVQANKAIPQSVKDQVKKALTNKSKLTLREDFANDMEILANEFGAEILNIIGFDALGFINRVLDPAKAKVDEAATLKNKQRVAEELSKKEGREITLDELKTRKEGKGLTVYKKGVKGDFYNQLESIKSNLINTMADLPLELDLSKVRPMNVKINGGLFDRIDKILNNKKGRGFDFTNLNAEGKKAELAKLEDEIREANTNNKILFKYLIKKLVNSNISDISLIRMLQLQTNAAEGFRSLTGLKYITVTDAPIGKLKGEHLADNGGTMLEIAELRYKNLNDSKLDEAIDDIIEYHDQWLENRDKLDFVDVFGKNNPMKDLRIRLAVDQQNIFTFDMKPAESLIKQREGDIKLKAQNKKTKGVRNTLELANSVSGERKGISVFDFDDTLAKSNSKVGVTMPNGTTRKINATEFALESADLEAAGAKFDFSEFNKVVEGKKGPLADLALKRQDKFGSGDIYVLTARPQEAAYAIHAFLKGIGLDVPINNITGLEDGRPEAKSDWILGKVAEGYNDFYFADDAIKNIKAVKDVLRDIDVKGRVELAFSESALELKINEIIEHQSGINKDARFSAIVAKRKGMNKNKYTLFLPPSAEDFEGLLYYMAGKGEQGSKDLAWLQDNLFKPYLKAVDAINIAKTSIVTDFRELNKQYKGIGKKLTTLMPDGNLTYDQGIRIYIWNKQGQDVPGISKRDLDGVLKEINKDSRLKEYADQIQLVGSGLDGIYAQAKAGWELGSILGDLDNLSNKVGRKRFLKDWIETKEAIFTPAVYTKLEAIYGARYVEAMKDILWRMENGTNRPSGANRATNAWLNWINNSVGTIMFFNRRSALLQGISFINFINWSDNNILKTAAAYANQPQFWKDFAMIWNSPKLKQRRRGLKTDLQWQEIANAAKNSKDKFNAAISWLLQIGFTPTQIMDNFAIASGGAPFYRNRVKTYIKQGMSKADAEAKAFDDFSEIAEKTQQSGDPALVSSEQASQLGRLILAFQNVTQQMTRLMKKSGTMLIKRQKYPDQSQFQSDMTNISKIIYYGAIQNFIFTFLQGAMFAMLPGFEGDEDEDALKQMSKDNAKQARMLNSMVDTLLRGSGLKGAILATIKNTILQYQKQEEKGFTADHTYTMLELTNVSPPIGSKLRKLYGAQQTKKFNKEVMSERGFEVMADGRFNLSPNYEIIGNLASSVLNLPLDRAINEIESLVEATDNRNARWQRIALALGWRTWDVNVKNEEEDAIKYFAKLKKAQEKKNKKKKKKENRFDYLD